MVKRVAIGAGRIVAVLLLIAGLYMLAAFIGSLIPRNGDWQQPESGITLYIETNGVHTGLVVPRQSDIADFSDLVRPEDLRDPARYGSHLLIGWGDGDFYRNTPTWDDFSLWRALRAMAGTSDTVLHIDHLTYPQAYPHYRRAFRVSEADYRRIATEIRAQFATDADGRSIASFGYGDDDSFYVSRGTYSAFRSCNSWVADLLATGGVRAPLWTPFEGGVMRWFGDD